MTHHHKSNQAVEGDPGSHSHGRGMPRRPDQEQLERRTVRDREEVRLLQDREELDEISPGAY